MDPAALPAQEPPLADPAGVPVGTTLPPEIPAPAGGVVPPAVPAAPSGNSVIPQVDIGKLSGQLADVQRQKLAANERVYGAMQEQIARDRARIEQAYEQSGIGPGDMQPWDQNAAREQFKYDPVEAFGSIGSVFAIVASAFTNAPMENAMFGAASAMNAIKENNKLEFDRSYKAWQDNTKLALERQKIQHERYKDSITLMQTNVSAAQAQLQVNAARFGDQQALFLLENGMSKELIELIDKRQTMALKLQQALPGIALDNEKMNDLLARTQGLERGTPEYNRAVQQWQQDWVGRKYDEDADFSRRWWEEHPQGTSEQFAADFARFKQLAGKLNPNELDIRRRTKELMDANPGMTETEARNQALRDTTNARSVQTIDRQLVPAIDARKKELMSGGMPEAEATAQATREVRTSAAAPSGNRLDDLQAGIDRVTLAESTIDKIDALLLKHSAITGLGGTITRPFEVVGNILGSNETDRVQFLRYVLELKELLPRIITGSNARPLAAEAANVNRIVAGLSPGDTSANTVRAYAELRPVLQRIKDALASRKQGLPGTGLLESSSSSATPPKASGAAPWANDPVVQ